MKSKPPSASLQRSLGLFGATVVGLGSILGTGVFVSVGLAAGQAGPAVLIAIVLAGAVALCNGLNSAQLAASHPVSGGAYEYGYAYATPATGFAAGWMFLCAKSASAATAALGFSGYLLNLFGDGAHGWLIAVAFMTVVALTLLALTGLRRTNLVNTAIVCTTILALAVFVLAGLPSATQNGTTHLLPMFPAPSPDGPGPIRALLGATALMFVAYTGYGRIATMGEEVANPRRTIPRAVMLTLAVSSLLYISVAAVAVASYGAEGFFEATRAKAAPLEIVARTFAVSGVAPLVAIGAMTAMLGVLLNLLLGLSRVVLAMGRRRDLPGLFARIHEPSGNPRAALLLVGTIIAGLTLLGSVKTAWSFSAFTVLVYYGINNYCALRIPEDKRLYPRALAWAGLASCLFLAFWVDTAVWVSGLGVLAAGMVWHRVARIVTMGS